MFIAAQRAVVASIVLITGAAAFGADANPTPGLEEIVVTATKRVERIQDVALAITAITQDRLQDLQAQNFADYAKLIPSLSLTENRPGQTVLTLQGISSFSGGATVGVYVDDTPYGSSSGLTNGQFYSGDLNTYDVQRVEVLKGPQGTLYGASTLGGLLKFVTNAPDPTHFAAEVQAGTESIDNSWGWSSKGMINLPISDIAAIRISGVHTDDPGYINDPSRDLKNINGSGQDGVRASFLVKPVEALTIRLTAFGQDSNYDDNNAIDVRLNTLGQPIIPIRPVTGDKQLNQNYSEYTHTRYRVSDLSIDWDMGFASLVSVTSYGTLRQTALVDDSLLGASPPVLNPINFQLDKFTQEVRLQSVAPSQPTANQLDWTVGGYYTRESALINSVLSGVYVAFNDYNLDGSYSDLASTFKEEAAFVTLTYHFTPQFDVAVGGRYAHNKQTSNETFGGLDALESSNTVGQSSQGVGLYSVAPRWRPTDNLTVYARVASGYRPGGPNDFPLGIPAGTASTFKDDTVVTSTLGVRSDFLNHRLSLDVSAFDTHWRDIQLVGDVMVDGLMTSLTQNGGTAQSRGLAWQLAFIPLSGLTLNLNGGFTDAKLTANTTSEVGGMDGNPLPYVPKWTTALDAAYEWDVAANTKAYIGALGSFVGDQFTAYSPYPEFAQIRLDSYTTLDLRAGIKRARWDAELFVKNATDERGITGLGSNSSANIAALTAPGYHQTVFIIQPRTVGLMLTARY
jgi:iron complex outermembrane recepter protein